MNLLSILLGLIALPAAALALLPLLGWINWLVLPVAAMGFGCGILSRRTSGRSLNLAVLVIAALRLMLGHGLF